MKRARPKKKPPALKPPAPPILGPGLGLLVLALVVYAPGLRNGYVNFDDGTYIIVNQTLHDEDGLAKIWSISKERMFYPLVFTTFRFERQIEQALGIIEANEPPNPQINHAINILLHGLAGIVLWRCLIRLGLGATLAYFATALWLVHPLQAESVVWAVERKNTLAGLFCFATVLMYVRAGTRMASGAYIAGLVLFLCALLSKSAFLLLPVTLLLCEWLQRRPLNLLAVIRALPFFIIALIFAAITVRGEHQAIIADIPSPTARLAIAGMGLWFYLGKLLWPLGTAVVYPRWDVTANLLTLLPLVAAIVGGIAWLFYAVRKSPSEKLARAAVLVAMAHYVFTLAPALGLIPFGYMELSFVANHFLYVPIVGPIVLVALALDALRRRVGLGRPAIAGAAVLIAALSAQSFARSLPWKDTIALSNHILESNPQCAHAHMVLGLELPVVRPDDPAALDEAIGHLQAAVGYQPARLQPHLALATLSIQAGRHSEAAEQFDAAIYILTNAVADSPKNSGLRAQIASVHLRAADALLHGPQILGVAAHLLRALEADPQTRGEVWKRVGVMVRQRAYREVIAFCDGLLKLKPSSDQALLIRGRCYLQLGDAAAADRDFDAAVAIEPKHRAAIEQLRRRSTTLAPDTSGQP